MKTDDQLRRDVVALVKQFRSNGLTFGRSGNVSVRASTGGFIITPSGIDYEDLKPYDLNELDFSGKIIFGKLNPSSEWRMHSAIYQARPDVRAIVHVHSPYATGVSCTRKPVPAFHYMITVLGGDQIPCAQYATFGTQEIADNAVEVLGKLNACLLANHGQIAVGEDLNSAMRYAGEVENLAKQYCISLAAGGPMLLDDNEMRINIDKFKTYGKQC